MISAENMRERYPQMVIDFYQDRIQWAPNKDSASSKKSKL